MEANWKCFICLYATVSFTVLLDCVANAREHKTWTAASIGSVSNDNGNDKSLSLTAVPQLDCRFSY